MQARPDYKIHFPDGRHLDLGSRTAVMAVLNLTPDSFSDGARFATPAAAVEAALRMADDGADIVDIGGESTRPGSDAVPEDEEIGRVVPVIEAIRRVSNLRISVDTMKAAVARRALDAGADMINDVGGFRDPELLPLLAERQVPVVVMHLRGTPKTMQHDTRYDDLMESITGFLEDRVKTAVAAGLSDGKILVDPGIGFGKPTGGNLAILKQLPDLHRVGRPVLVGASRKSFIGAALDLPVDQRLEGSLAVAAYASAQGANVIRAHDVTATVRTVRMIDAIREGSEA